MADSQDAIVSFLTDPATHGGQRVERVSTHGAHIFLAGARAYKIKRAVAYSFMDFSTLAKRHAALEAELSLNRRTAPSLYLGLEPIVSRAGGGLAIGGPGDVREWVLVMRRFDQEALLSAVARRGALTGETIDLLADAIADAHKAAPAVHRDEARYFLQQARDDIAPLLGLPGADRLGAQLESACRRLKDHIDARTKAGFVRHGHGDLHLNNIVVVEGKPVLFDALEFDPALATGDVYYDLAFLLMDLDHAALRPAAHRLFNRYVTLTDDIEGLAALPLFLATRAAVRAKVAVLRAGANAREEAQAYIDLANSYLPAPSPRLVAVGGLSGTGKSTVARLIAPGIGAAPGAVVIRSDVVRKRLFGAAETQRLAEDAYTTAATEAVYGTMLTQARRALAAGYSVILDAVHSREAERAAPAALADSLSVPFTGLWLEASLSAKLARVGSRTNDASDATPELVTRQDSYNTGAINWRMLRADDTPEAVAAAATQWLK